MTKLHSKQLLKNLEIFCNKYIHMYNIRCITHDLIRHF